MSGSFLLDTNIVIAILAKEPAVHQRLAEATEVFVPSIVLGEYYGARKSSRVESNIEAVDQFTAASRVLVCDSTTALHYGEIKNLLREKGRPSPENDILDCRNCETVQIDISLAGLPLQRSYRIIH